jgi:mitochondrial fission protein ELM1
VRVLLISDGRPGHYRQSEGVVASLSRRGPIVVDRLEIGLRLPLPKALVPKLGRLLPPGWFLPAVHGVDPGRMEKPDIIVSAGGATLAANVGLARIWNVPNVFSGSTRGFALDRFRLVLTPYASVAEPPKVVAGPKPTPFDPDRVPLPRPIQSAADMRGARVSILIGGPTWYAAFEPDDWRRLASLAEALVEKLGCRLTIVTSPRTPSAAYDHVLPLAGKLAGAVSLIDFRTAGPGSIERSFDCDLVLVTSDSMSMMTEAALSRRPAVALVPDKVKPARDDEAVAGLVAERWLATLPLASADADGLASLAASLEPLDGNHLDRLAAVVCAAAGLDAS